MIQIKRKGKVYQIVWYSQYGVEVVDEASTKKEALYLKKEYEIAFRNC